MATSLPHHAPAIANAEARPAGDGAPRVNAPYDVPASEAAIFWLGRVTPTENAADVRVVYRERDLYVRVAVFDRRLWYDRSPSLDDLTMWDSVSLYLDTSGNQGDETGVSTLRFDAQLVWWESRENYQAVYMGDGGNWLSATLPFTTTSFWRGDEPNNDLDDRGWALTYEIPYESLGLDGPPTQNAVWGMAVTVHDRDDVDGTPIPEQVWPAAMDTRQPATWGQLVFGMPVYEPPSALPTTTVTIRHGLDGAVVPDADVGGSSVCGGVAGPEFFPTWGDLNYAGKEFLNVQNLGDVGDWPCFSRYYVVFPIETLPTEQVVVSATLTLYQFGNAGDGYIPGPKPSLIQVLTVSDDWEEESLTWNNAPQARENVSAAWTEPLDALPEPPGVARQWDVSRAVAEAHASGQPLRLALYESDWAYHSGKYFHSSDVGDWNEEGRPTLTVTLGRPVARLTKMATPTSGRRQDTITYVLNFYGTGQGLTLTDTLPEGVSTPTGFEVQGTSVVPTYDQGQHRLTWSDAPPAGQAVTIRYTVDITTAASQALVNVAELEAEGTTASTATATVRANVYRVHLPIVTNEN